MKSGLIKNCMKMFLNKKHLFTGFIILLSASHAFSQFSATVSNNAVAVGDQFQVTFTLDGNGKNFQAPAFSNFNTLMGPSQSTSMQIMNGSVSQTISYTYVLQAIKE